jgi:hypothetical protein
MGQRDEAGFCVYVCVSARDVQDVWRRIKRGGGGVELRRARERGDH